MSPTDARSRAERRLAEELEDDGITLDDDPAVVGILIEELDYARRIATFEGRAPLYGSIVLGDGSLENDEVGLDILPVESDLAAARMYADGRSSYVVRHPQRPLSLACFDRAMQYEADLVRLQEATGAQFLQRTPVFGVLRLFRPGSILAWNGHRWNVRRTASTMLPGVMAAAPHLDPIVARGLVDLAVHWLSPARIGATLVVRHDDVDTTALETSRSAQPPPLSIANRRHFPPLLACLQQHDLATVMDEDGRVEGIEVGLVASSAAQAAVPGDHGMRHRSAQRWSFDHPSSVVVVVSEDGPVTVYREGRTVVG